VRPIKTDENFPDAHGNTALGIAKPEYMSLADIIDEMIKIAVENPRVVKEVTYRENTFEGRRYTILGNHLIEREDKYLKFDKMLSSYAKQNKRDK